MKELKHISTLFILLAVTCSVTFGQSYYVVKPHPVSTRFNNEECPVLIGNKLIFLSNRSNSSFKKYFDTQERNYFHIYTASLDTVNKSWSVPESFNPNLTTNLSDGPLSIDSSGRFIAFSRSLYSGKGGKNKNNPHVGIFFANRKGEKWQDVSEFQHNTLDAQTTHPSINNAGKVMYFASDRTGGFGGYDLYVSYLENGSWSDPKNLGPLVNTTENELYPFIHPSGRLYFSSMGHDKNVGGYDIFYTEFYNLNWIKPIKLPGPINSGMKDFSYFVDEKFEKGFFTSTRRGSVDIFNFSSNLPTFEVCQEQKKDNFCFLLYEENTMEMDTSLYAYEWNLGDGTKVRDIQAKHCYQDPGKYVVNLDVIDKLTKEVLFNQASYDLEVERIEQPYITLPDSISVNQEIQFNGVQSYFKTIKPGEFYWDFGDGFRGIGASAKHVYKVPGKYTVKLGVIEDDEDIKNPARFCSFKMINILEK